MKLNTYKKGDYQVLSIEGRIDTTNYNEFENVMIELIEKRELKFVIDCSQLNYISSSGLRIFLSSKKKLYNVQGVLHLCCLQTAIKEIFDISGFSSIFNIYDTLEAATA